MKLLTKKVALTVATAVAVVGIGAATMDAGSAGAWGQTEYEAELSKVQDFSDLIGGIITSMTTIAISPIGIGSSIRVFRHIVLNNV